MGNYEKIQIIVIIVALLGIATTSIQLVTMDTSIEDKTQNKYISSVDSVEVIDSLYNKFKSSGLAYSRDLGNYKIKKVEKVVEKKPTEKKVETYWVKSGLELYGLEDVSFSMFFDNKATFKVKGKNKKFMIGDKIPVGKIKLIQKVKGSNATTGNSKIGKEFSGEVLYVGPRSVYVEHYKSNLAVKFKTNLPASVVAKDLVPSSSSNETDPDNDSGEETEEKTGGRRRR